MKKIIIAVFAFLTLSTATQAQQLPLFSQYLLNGFLLNPAMAGSNHYSPIRATIRQQWVGLTGAPETYALSGHTQLAGNMGVGGYIFSDKFGPVSRTGLQGSYAYHLNLGNDLKLGLGLSLSAFQYKLDESNLDIIDQSDYVINGAVETTFVPDANFGAYLYNDKFFVGFAAQQLFQFKIKLENNNDENQMVRHYFLTGGYTFAAGEKLDLQPSLLLKGTEKSPFQLDFNLKAIYQKNYWFGLSYRTQDALIALLGIKINNYYIGYGFDYTLSKIMDYSSGSHEIMIGINLGEGKDSGSSLL
jgi:type IX secretion system PorP/SprF family membrane protein